MIARASLSDITSKKCCIEIAKMVARGAHDDGAERAFVVIYCSAIDEFRLHSYKRHARCFTEALNDIPAETWVINQERYFRVGCEGESCCPPEGFPVSDLANTEASTALVYRGYAPALSREEYVQLPQPTPSQTGAAHSAERKFNAEKRRSVVPDNWRQKAFSTWQNALELSAQGKVIPPSVLGVLGAALTDTTMRDAVLLSCLPDGLGAAKNVIVNTGAAQQTASELLTGVVGDEDSEILTIAPNQTLVRNATTVLEAVVGHATEAGKPGPLTLLAFLAWWLGDGTRANTRARQALAYKPEYQLATTLANAIDNHLLPGWIRQRHAAAAKGKAGAQSDAQLRQAAA